MRCSREWHAHLSAHISGLDFDVLGKGYAACQKIFDAHFKYCGDMPQDASLLFKELASLRQEALSSRRRCPLECRATPCRPCSPGVTFSPRSGKKSKHRLWSSWKTGGSLSTSQPWGPSTYPLLLSGFQETQRARHIHAAIRKVMKDTLLDDKYLLKTGNCLYMPGNSIHSNTNVWGPSAGVFDPYRFVQSRNPVKNAGNDFLAWGAPPHLYPARQFAATGILILALRRGIQPWTLTTL